MFVGCEIQISHGALLPTHGRIQLNLLGRHGLSVLRPERLQSWAITRSVEEYCSRDEGDFVTSQLSSPTCYLVDRPKMRVCSA